MNFGGPNGPTGPEEAQRIYDVEEETPDFESLLADEMDRDYFDYPVYIDGMIKAANALHTAYPEFLSEKVQKNMRKRLRSFSARG